MSVHNEPEVIYAVSLGKSVCASACFMCDVFVIVRLYVCVCVCCAVCVLVDPKITDNKGRT